MWKISTFKNVSRLFKNNGVKESQIVTINFEDLDYEELTNYKN